MLRMTLALSAMVLMLGCNNSSSGGGNGGGGNNPPQKPAGYVGACNETVQTNNGQAQVCTEYYEGQTKITKDQLQQACANAGIQFTQVCPANPSVTCQVQHNGFSTIHLIYDQAANRDAWVQQCQAQGGVAK